MNKLFVQQEILSNRTTLERSGECVNRKNKIDLQKQLSEFYSTLDFKPISANAISIYLVLLQIDCKTDWLREFKVTNTILMSKVKCLNISALQRARNELINNQYILYKKRNKSK